ncbi:MAG: class I SAM-dependent methyltransferase [Candidatus Thorarchaeota archaeon]
MKDIVREGYNKIAKKYLAVRHENLPEMNLLVDFTRSLPKDAKILDAGCGSGIPFTKYLSNNFDVLGIDISKNQIKLAKKNVPKAKFLCEDMTKIVFPEETFDAIISFYAIIHVPREEHGNLIAKFYSMLKKSGRVLLCFHSNDDPGSYEDDFFGERMFWSGFDKNTNIEMLEEIGFIIEKTELVADSLSENSQHLFIFAKK